MNPVPQQKKFTVPDYDLAGTLNSGQAFRWVEAEGGWEGVIGRRAVRLRQAGDRIEAASAGGGAGWTWLRSYLQLDVDLAGVIASFPDDEAVRTAIGQCRGLRLLRQDPWECLASFLLSSNKQIVQIRQMVATICRRYGPEIEPLPGRGVSHAFPGPERIARCTDNELLDCRLGYRAPWLRESARMVADGEVDLKAIAEVSCEEARFELLRLPGVGRKVADCVLLFGCGFQEAFPVDVWIARALKELYFARKRKVTQARLVEFSREYFGPHGGFAQQYLFHYMRTRGDRTLPPGKSSRPGASLKSKPAPRNPKRKSHAPIA